MFARDRAVFLSARAATTHDIKMCLTELVELENRPDPAPTSSRKSENRNRALSKSDNENFQLNPPRLIISYVLEHYPRIDRINKNLKHRTRILRVLSRRNFILVGYFLPDGCT